MARKHRITTMKQTCTTINERNSSVKITKKVAVIGAASAALALMLAGCGTGTTTTPSTTDTAATSDTATSAAPAAPSSITIAYIQKQAGQQYFVAEKQGAQDKADSLGVKVTFYPLADNADDSAAIDAVNQAIAAKVNGIIIVPPDGAVGPQVTQLANDAGIKIMSSDDMVCDNNPDPTQCDPAHLLPRVGFDGTEMGTEVGTEAATLFKASGWAPADTAIVRSWGAEVTVCTQRVDGAAAAFTQNGASAGKTIDLSTDNTPTGAQDKAAAMLTANQGVKNWVVWGCNDENVSGVVTAMQNSGISPDNIIAVGLGGYLACKPWNTSTATGIKAALYISGIDVGSTSIQVMHDWIANGTQPPAQTLAPTHMVTPDNWKTTMSAGDLAACQAS